MSAKYKVKKYYNKLLVARMPHNETYILICIVLDSLLCYLYINHGLEDKLYDSIPVKIYTLQEIGVLDKQIDKYYNVITCGINEDNGIEELYNFKMEIISMCKRIMRY